MFPAFPSGLQTEPSHGPLPGAPGDACITLENRQIRYTLHRSRRRRTIALSIDERGLRVAAPLRAAQSAIDALLRQHAAWVIRRLGAWQDRRPPPRRWMAGEHILLHGNPVTLQTHDLDQPRLENGRLLFGPPTLPATVIEARVQAWLKQQALTCFTERCRDFSARLDLPAPEVRLSNARTRWGSCHASGRIRMNWRLVQAPMAWIDYVAAHEVAHLRQMNHSPAFWKIVATLVADYAARRAALRRDAHRYLLL